MARHRTKEEQTRIVQAWRASGQSTIRFARDYGVSPNSLKRWANAIEDEHTFVRLEVAAATSGKIAVEVGGTRVVVESGFDRALLRAVVEALS